jgi:hypothetical protein
MTDPEPEIVVDTDAEAEPPGCVHHWLLGEPTGGMVVGRCKRCDATRIYPASPDSTDRFDDYRELTASSSYNARLRSA